MNFVSKVISLVHVVFEGFLVVKMALVVQMVVILARCEVFPVLLLASIDLILLVVQTLIDVLRPFLNSLLQINAPLLKIVDFLLEHSCCLVVRVESEPHVGATQLDIEQVM